MDYKKILFSEIAFEPERIINNFNNNNNDNNDHKNNDDNNNTKLDKRDNQNGFQKPKLNLSDPNLVKLNWLQREKVGGGLMNVGNTCFLNSVLQCLTYCAPLYNFLVKCDGGHQLNCKVNGAFCMLCEMEKLIRKIRNSSGTSIKPISIVQRLSFIHRSFQHGRQEDAHEFLRFLIDHMWKACLKNLGLPKADSKAKETTIINHIFGGYHRSQVECLTCRSRSDTYEFFMELILDIRYAKSLQDALRKFTQAERLENDNAYKCSNCRKYVVGKKKFTVHKEPNVATFQLKRFDSDRIFGGKITRLITYPEELDLRPFMSDTTKPPIKYQLNAVLVHSGSSSNSGHYYCYVRNSDNFWYKMDDSTVSNANIRQVLDQQAYMLFYTRKQIIRHNNNNNNNIGQSQGIRKEKFSKFQHQKSNKNIFKYQFNGSTNNGHHNHNQNHHHNNNNNHHQHPNNNQHHHHNHNNHNGHPNL